MPKKWKFSLQGTDFFAWPYVLHGSSNGNALRLCAHHRPEIGILFQVNYMSDVTETNNKLMVLWAFRQLHTRILT